MNKSIEQILQQPEGKQLEFKRDLSSPKPIMKSLTAFANTAGGILSKAYSNRQSIFILSTIGSNHAITH